MDQWNCIGTKPADTWESMRLACHSTFNGGFNEPDTHVAFHAGMDTVFRCLMEGGFKEMHECRSGVPQPVNKTPLPPLTSSDIGDSVVKIVVDGKEYAVPGKASGALLKGCVGKDSHYQVFRQHAGVAPDLLVHDQELIEVTSGDIFYTIPHAIMALPTVSPEDF